MKVNQFYTPQPAVKFAAIGDSVDGTIVEQPKRRPDEYGTASDQVLVLAIHDSDDVTRRLFARNQMLGAIGRAVTDAGVDEIECGGRLRVTYVSDKQTGGAAAMKVYEAEYSPPAPIGVGTFGDDGDDGEETF